LRETSFIVGRVNGIRLKWAEIELAESRNVSFDEQTGPSKGTDKKKEKEETL